MQHVSKLVLTTHALVHPQAFGKFHGISSLLNLVSLVRAQVNLKPWHFVPFTSGMHARIVLTPCLFAILTGGSHCGGVAWLLACVPAEPGCYLRILFSLMP